MGIILLKTHGIIPNLYIIYFNRQGLSFIKEVMRSRNWHSTPRDQTSWTGSDSINWPTPIVSGMTLLPRHGTSLLSTDQPDAASSSTAYMLAVLVMLAGWWLLDQTVIGTTTTPKTLWSTAISLFALTGTNTVSKAPLSVNNVHEVKKDAWKNRAKAFS